MNINKFLLVFYGAALTTINTDIVLEVTLVVDALERGIMSFIAVLFGACIGLKGYDEFKSRMHNSLTKRQRRDLCLKTLLFNIGTAYAFALFILLFNLNLDVAYPFLMLIQVTSTFGLVAMLFGIYRCCWD